MLVSAEMPDCTGRVFPPSALKSPSLSTTMGISAPLKDCFEELHLNKDIPYVPQITCYRYIFPKPLVCSPNEINLFFPCIYFQRCMPGIFGHMESWAHKSAGGPDRAAGAVLCSSALAPAAFLLNPRQLCVLQGKEHKRVKKKNSEIKISKSICHLRSKTVIGKFIHLTTFLSSSSLQLCFFAHFHYMCVESSRMMKDEIRMTWLTNSVDSI